MRLLPVISLTSSLLWPGCSSKPRPAPRPEVEVRLWHNFNPHETEALNAALSRSPAQVEVTMVPFPRGFTLLRRVFESGEGCPDLVRIDASWLPGLARAGVLERTPDLPALAERDWLPEADELTRDRGARYAVPQSLDGLGLIHRPASVDAANFPWPPRTVDDLESIAGRLRTRTGDSALGVRVDGYWYAAFLRARGGSLLRPERGTLGIDEPVAARALEAFAELFGPGDLGARQPAPGEAERTEIRLFRDGATIIAINGPWSAYDLGGGSTDGLAVAPFPAAETGQPAAPRGGQLFVVPTCAAHPTKAWELAAALSEPKLQADWGRRFGIVPTTRQGLDGAGEFSAQFYAALQRARPLPRHPLTPETFDDLTPAIAAVVAGDATAEEALAGTRRAWRRLAERHGVAIQPSAASTGGTDAGPTPGGGPR